MKHNIMWPQENQPQDKLVLPLVKMHYGEMVDLFKSGPTAASAMAENAYSAKDIEVLEGLEPVRRRPGMYIGGTDERAMHHLVAEVLDNAMDEAVAGHATRIEIELSGDQTVSIRDNGRGIPVDRHPKLPTNQR